MSFAPFCVVLGAVNLIYGLAAIVRDEVLAATGGSRLIVWDLTAWGWILLFFGIFQFLAGAALFGGAGWRAGRRSSSPA